MKLSIIVAVAENNAIGLNNDLLWHIPDDLKRFKRLTQNHVIIMGQKTYESLPIRPLPNRQNIVISDDPDFRYEGILVATSIQESIMLAEKYEDNDEIFVIGGGSIYKQFLPIVDKLYITKVHKSFDADVFFPEIDESKWELIEKEDRETENFKYSFLSFVRIS